MLISISAKFNSNLMICFWSPGEYETTKVQVKEFISFSLSNGE